MKKKWLHRSLNFFFKAAILTTAVLFLLENVEEHSLGTLWKKPFNRPEFYLPAFLLLWLFNLFIDALFWQKVHLLLEEVSLSRGLKINLICYSLAFVTPANTGEWAGRYVMMTEPENRRKSFFLNFWMHLPRLFSKLIIAILAASILLVMVTSWSPGLIALGGLLMIGLLLWIYFSFRRLQNWLHLKQIGSFKLENYLLEGRPYPREKAKFLMYAALKFITYNLQFAVLLLLFTPSALSWEIMLLIPLYFLLGSLLPGFAFADFIIKSAVAIWVFQLFLNNDALLVLSSICIWLFNVALPAFAGMYFILKTNLLRSLKKKFSRDIPNGL